MSRDELYGVDLLWCVLVIYSPSAVSVIACVQRKAKETENNQSFQAGYVAIRHRYKVQTARCFKH